MDHPRTSAYARSLIHSIRFTAIGLGLMLSAVFVATL